MQSAVLGNTSVGAYSGGSTTVAGPTVVRQVAASAQPAQGRIYASAYQTTAPAARIVAAQPQAVASTVLRPATTTWTVPATYTAASAGMPTTTTVIRSSQASTAPLSSSVRIQPQSAVAAAQVVSASQAPPPQTRPHTLAGPGYTQGAYEAKHQDDPQLQNLKELRKTSGLKMVPVNEGLSMLKAAAEDGKLSRENFLRTYTALLQAHEVDVPPESVQNAVFDLFDRDDNNVVDMMELICGISLLCSGTEDDKIQAVFNVFDENSDGYISMDEMFKFLTSVFKVVLTPNVIGVMNSMGVTVESAEDLASVTALECFRTADLNNDGKLSIVEFKNWFYAPRNDPSFLFSPVRKLLL
mmetsp:Transcript_93685/g.260811  ORF Transcript_93685/g.260811 Transcript_93685/m.260811 type:complete len:355 (-) Transcript_93685:149-1213(-)